LKAYFFQSDEIKKEIGESIQNLDEITLKDT